MRYAAIVLIACKSLRRLCAGLRNQKDLPFYGQDKRFEGSVGRREGGAAGFDQRNWLLDRSAGLPTSPHALFALFA